MPEQVWIIPSPSTEPFEQVKVVVDLADDNTQNGGNDLDSTIVKLKAARDVPAFAIEALEAQRDSQSGEVEKIIARNSHHARFRTETAAPSNVEPVHEHDAPEGADVDERSEIARILARHRPPCANTDEEAS